MRLAFSAASSRAVLSMRLISAAAPFSASAFIWSMRTWRASTAVMLAICSSLAVAPDSAIVT